MNTVVVNGIEIYVEVHGSGPPLVLIAGLASDSQSWLPVIAPLAEHFTVIVYDNRGVGRTAPADAPISIALLADDCARLLDRLGYPKVHLLGHSMGGLVAQQFAARHADRIDRLILVGTDRKNPARNDDLLLEMAASLESGTSVEDWLRELFRWLFTERFLQSEDAVTEAIRVAVEYPYPQSPEQFRRQVEAVVAFDGVDASRIAAPTLVVTGSEDRLFPPQVGRALAEQLRDGTFLVVPDAAHSIHMEAPGPFVDAVVAFLKGP